MRQIICALHQSMECCSCCVNQYNLMDMDFRIQTKNGLPLRTSLLLCDIITNPCHRKSAWELVEHKLLIISSIYLDLITCTANFLFFSFILFGFTAHQHILVHTAPDKKDDFWCYNFFSGGGGVQGAKRCTDSISSNQFCRHLRSRRD